MLVNDHTSYARHREKYQPVNSIYLKRVGSMFL